MKNQTLNPFSQNNQAPLTHQNALVEAEIQRSITEVQGAMTIAKRFPRDPVQAMDKILNACQRPKLASTAVYQYARGGTSITGASIRLAEAIAQQWGNIHYGIRELSQNNGESTVEAFAWDLETNTKQVKVFQVAHTRYSKSHGNTKLNDPRDIYETIASNGARRLRACILGVIPSDVVESALQQCYITMQANADCSPEGIRKLLTSFANIGVSKEAIEKRIQCRVEAMQPAQIISLINIGTSIRDGYAQVSDFFEVKPEVETNIELNNAVKQAIATTE